MAAIIDVEHLRKSYGGARGIRDVSFAVEPGEVFGFLRPNGAGKTTTIRLLMALLRADAGSARIGGLDCWEQAVAIKRMVGYVPGEPALDPNLTGGQLLEYFGSLHGGVDQAYLKSLVECFGLDPLNQQTFEQMVREAAEAGSTVFLSSHILSEVEQLCSRVGIIREGELVQVGTVADLKGLKRSELTLIFAEPVPPSSFASLSGVEQVSSSPDGRTLRLTMQGGADAVIKAAGAYSVQSVSSHEPSLEDVFLRYYQTPAAGGTVAAQPEREEASHA